MKIDRLKHLNNNRTFVCTHCGTWFQSDKYNESGMSMCPFCGEWAVPTNSPKGKLFESVYFTLSKYEIDVNEIMKYMREMGL